MKVSLAKQVAEADASIEKAKTELIVKEKLLASRQKTMNEHTGKIRTFESEKKIKHERLKFLSDKSENIREQIVQDKQGLERVTFSIQSLDNEKTAATLSLDELRVVLETAKKVHEEQKLKTSSLESEHNQIAEVYRKGKDELYTLIKDIEIKEVQLSSLKRELEKTASDSSEKTANLVAFDNKLKQLREVIAAKDAELDAMEKSEVHLQKTIESTQKTIEVIQEERLQTARKLDARQNEYNLTKSLVDNLEGFPEAIKFLKKRGINAPLLSDIISCDDKYRVTIENYLDPFMNYYVVENEDEAYHAINLISDAAKGKAHFFILNKFENYHPKDTQLFDNAIPATEIVEFENRYKRLVAHILDDVYIVTGPESNIPKESDCIFITQNGKITRRKFSISGGSVGLFEGKRIGRAKNLEKLQVEIKKLHHKLDDVEEKIKDKQAELDRAKGQTRKIPIELLRKDTNLLHQELVSYETKQEQMASLLSSNTVRREDILENIEQFNAEITLKKPEADSLRITIEHQFAKLEDLSGLLSAAKELLDERSTEFNEKNVLFIQHQNKLNSLIQEISYKEGSRLAAEQRIEKNSRDLIRNEDEIKKLLESNDVGEDELRQLYNEKDAIEKGVNEAEREYYAQRGHIDELEKNLRLILTKKDNLDALLLELQTSVNELKLEISSVKNRLVVEFDVDPDLDAPDAPTEQILLLSIDELSNKVAECKSTLDRIGPINPMALEAYDEIKNRHTFITDQKNDLVTAKESLLATIEEIDLVARETFVQSFEKIKTNFVKVFRSMFTEEDDCDLRLLNPGNPLESEIEVIAKPKGKKPLTISQLSGGEKALTAISLLFAIYLLKPAPFCIFDEVDAPLDDANIDKFNEKVRQFAEGSQFIIITHNKRTMSKTDVIYGITMIEQGVSRVVPVDLRSLE